jgi:hypothetical protein
MPSNPALIARPRAIPAWLKSGFLITLVFVASWGGAITYWRMTGSSPATGALFLYLFGFPVCLLLAFFIGRKLLVRPTAASTSAALPAPAKAAATSTQTLPLAIVAASLRLPHGASPEELASAIADNKARPDLDKELVDDGGFPVMTARCSEAVDEELQEEITDWLAVNGMADVHFSDEQWRALTLASAVVTELAAQAASPISYRVNSQTRLQLIPILPAEWDVVHRRATGMWLKQELTRHGWSADRVVVTVDETGSAGDVTPSAIFKRLTHDAAAANAPLLAMVVACASHIGDETIAQWAASGSLFTSSQPQGRIPGEGAAGLLITNQVSLADAATIALLGGIEDTRRELSADETRRSDPTLLGELADRVLERSGMNASDMTMLIADTGQRSSRVLELMAHVSARFPQLEETDSVVRAGVASGTCDAVPFMTALALGTHYVMARNAPVLCISNEDPYCRAVVLLRPSGLLSKND